MPEKQSSSVKGSKSAIWRFSFKSSRRGAFIFGLAAGCMVILQGLAFAATYAGDVARAKFATSLASNPALGIMYGEIRQIETPSGYMVYRTMTFLSFIGGLWALAAVTRMLRGQEEDGRMELLITGKSTLSGALVQIMKGMFVSLLLAYLICGALLIGLGRSPKIQVSVSASLFFALMLLCIPTLFACIGALTSQLAATRRRAMVYGAIALFTLFVVRAFGNVIHSMRWLKNFTPFGWIDKMHAVTGSDWHWLLPFFLFSAIFLGLAYYFVNQRDLRESIIADQETAEPHFMLLGGSMALSFRLTRATLLGWLLCTVSISAFIVALAKTAVNALQGSDELTKALGNITNGTNSLLYAFIGFGGFFAALLIMAMVATGIGRMREDEAKGYVDNFLVSPLSRSRWLIGRVVVLLLAATFICFIANLTCIAVAKAQGISVPIHTVIWGGFNYLAPSFLILGLGVFLFGIKPRIASIILYAWIAWSFIIEMAAAVVHMSDWVIKSSLLRHMTIVPGATVDWRAFGVICGISIVALGLGTVLFSRRDLQLE
jgi:ABC-2 type transport system permease protein